MAPTVTVTDGAGTSKRFRALVASGLLPTVQQAFGAGVLEDSDGITLTMEYGTLEDGATYKFTGGRVSRVQGPR